MKKENGQAITELMLSLGVFASLLIGLQFVSDYILAKNRAQIFQHQALFQGYRQSEGYETTPLSNPDPKRLEINQQREHFQGRVWLDLEFPKSNLFMTYKPTFAYRAWHFLGLKNTQFFSSTKMLRDPWNEHPIRYALYGVAAGITLVKKVGAISSAGGTELGDHSGGSSFSQYAEVMQEIPGFNQVFEGDLSFDQLKSVFSETSNFNTKDLMAKIPGLSE